MEDHLNISIIYLSQNYFELDKHTIRDNCNYLIIFKVNESDIKSLYTTLTSSDFNNYKEFKTFLKEGLKEKYSFLCINKKETNLNKKYSKGFDNFYKLNMTDDGTQLKEEKQLNENKKKAVTSEDRLRGKIRELKNANLGLYQTTSQIFKPITQSIETTGDKSSQGVKDQLDKLENSIPEFIHKYDGGDYYFGMYQTDKLFNPEEFIFYAVIVLTGSFTNDLDNPGNRNAWKHYMVLDQARNR